MRTYPLWGGVALQAFSVIVLWERGGLDWAALGRRLYEGGRGRPFLHWPWGFDPMTGKRGGNEFD
jgi:hypothetical protein